MFLVNYIKSFFYEKENEKENEKEKKKISIITNDEELKQEISKKVTDQKIISNSFEKDDLYKINEIVDGIILPVKIDFEKIKKREQDYDNYRILCRILKEDYPYIDHTINYKKIAIYITNYEVGEKEIGKKEVREIDDYKIRHYLCLYRAQLNYYKKYFKICYSYEECTEFLFN